MKEQSLRILDSLVPEDIKEFEQGEELIRARSLVFILLFHTAVTAVTFLAYPFGGLLPADLYDISPYASGLPMLGYALSLWLFYNLGIFALSGNLYAISSFGSVVFAILAVPQYAYLALVLLFVPILLSLIANHSSGVFWLIITALTPQVVNLAGSTIFSEYFIGSWLVVCLGLCFALFLEHYYREAMRKRLDTERTEFEFAAAHDPLTGVANRTTFDRRLRECIDYCSVHGTRAVLLYIDLDKFKPINDTYGHQAGDIVLTTISGRLRKLVRNSDTVARLGGDEFAILFEQCDPDSLNPVIERVRDVIATPIEIEHQWLTVGCSIGKVVCPDDGTNPETLAQIADERMYEQKRSSADSTPEGVTLSTKIASIKPRLRDK